MPAIIETSWTLMLPTVDYVFYGRPVAAYIDDSGFIVAGHDRRAFAAVNQMCPEQEASRTGNGRHIPVKARWVIFHTTCGCTPEQHAKHGAPVPDNYLDLDNIFGECWDHCEYGGLPPCGDEFSWIVTHEKAEVPGAIPILEVIW